MLALAPAAGAQVAPDASSGAGVVGVDGGVVDGSAGEVVEQVTPIEVSNTDASAGSDGADASSTPLGVGDIVDTGSEQSGNGSSSDAVADTGGTPLGRASVAPSSATASESDTSSSSSARSDVARASSADGDIDVAVGSARSSADWNADESSSSGETVLLEALLFDEEVRVLHATSNSSGEAVHLLQIGDESPIPITSDEANEICAAFSEQTPPADVACAETSDGVVRTMDAETADDLPVALRALAVTANSADGSGATGTTVASGAVPGADGSAQFASSNSAAADPSGASNQAANSGPFSSLPRTGLALGLLGAIGAAAIAAGGGFKSLAGRFTRS